MYLLKKTLIVLNQIFYIAQSNSIIRIAFKFFEI